ncbi:MAG TPA: serine/threonine protein kinase [Candidatus Blautia stercorigallinarum]|uniref:Serine/threonine protein kinase n=1 Tax=Candidatus Blautia stercorigallinarum TaxID=2838501 RepID=A0A9D1THB2_9FIRM|nr:serine/threonine protein kinase [Candidatus Blautia stercorigallinarum]
MLEIGSLVDGKYKILNKIGQGGMSVVYLAMNERANKQWAIKEVRKDGVQNFEVVKQGLIAETEMLKKLSHPNLPSIIDVIDGDGTFLIVMDYIEGRHLESVAKEYGAQSQEDVIEWAKQLCDVLSYLHSRKPPIIYRDMKPSNVMLKPDGKVMLIDFGTAREFKENSVADTTCLGTQGYAAPEQYGGHGQTDARTDIYCLGATLYHLLTGHNPSEPPYEMYPIRYWNPELSSGLEEIILKCTQKNPDDRYQNCGGLLYALEHYNELDIEYKRKQTLKWRAFLCSAALTVVAGAGATGFKIAENTVTASTYETYVEEADNLASTDPEQCIQYYKNAIALNPSDGLAYEKLLNFFLWEHNDSAQGDTGNEAASQQITCVFSDAEEQEIRKVLGTEENKNRRNEEYLKANVEDYDKFAYDLGIAYYFSYNGTGNKGAARKWLEIASEAEITEKLNEANINRAANLYKISEYYDSLGMRNQAGDSRVSYADYWRDLQKTVEDDSASGNNVNILLAYKEMTFQIADNAANFKSAGITRQQMENELDHAVEAVGNMKIVTGSANAEYEQELKYNLIESLGFARNIVHSTFNRENLAIDIQGGEQDAADTAAD